MSLGYQRAYLLRPGYTEGTQITQAETPAIPIQSASIKATSFQVTIDFSGTSGSTPTTNFYPAVDLNGSPIVVQSGSNTDNLAIARYLAIPNTPFSAGSYILQGFGSGDFANDQGTDNGMSPPGDIPASITDTLNTTTQQGLVLGLYAIAYGLVDFTTPIYSTPTALGYVKYYTKFTSTSTPTPTYP